MDVCNTSFDDHSFDLIIDKGMIDALISTGEGKDDVFAASTMVILTN